MKLSSVSYHEWRAAFRKGSAPDAIISKAYLATTEAVGERQIKMTLSTGAIDRDNDIVKADGWDLAPYRENPVVLWAHQDKELPIGRSVKTWVQGGALKSVCEFATAEMNPKAANVYELVKGGFLRGNSVGFRPIEFADAPQRKGIDFTKQELYEYSVIPIPSNREALAEAKAAGLVIAPVLEWCKQFVEESGEAGLWLPKSVVEDAIRKASPARVSLAVPGVSVKAAPAAPPQAPTPSAGHAASGAAQPQSAAAQMAGQPPQNRYLTVPDDLAKPMLVQEILSIQQQTQPPVAGAGNPVWALMDSLRSIAEFGGEQMDGMAAQSFEQFDTAMQSYEGEPDEGEPIGDAEAEGGTEDDAENATGKDDDAEAAAGAKADEAGEKPPFPPKKKPPFPPKKRNPFAPKSAFMEMVRAFASATKGSVKAKPNGKWAILDEGGNEVGESDSKEKAEASLRVRVQAASEKDAALDTVLAILKGEDKGVKYPTPGPPPIPIGPIPPPPGPGPLPRVPPPGPGKPKVPKPKPRPGFVKPRDEEDDEEKGAELVTYSPELLDEIVKGLPPMEACPNCGMKVKKGSEKCPHCSASMSAEKGVQLYGGITVEEIGRIARESVKEAMQGELMRLTGRLPD